MANQPPESGNYPGTPRWVKAFGIVFLALVVLLVVMIVTGHGGPHSPLRHLRSGGASGQTPPAAGAQSP
jgi:hypothetical protein